MVEEKKPENPHIYGPTRKTLDFYQEEHRKKIREAIEQAEYVSPVLEANNKKYDEGKILVGLMKQDFPRALLAVAEVTTYGVKKYNQPGSWRKIVLGISRYEDALGRHDLEMAKNPQAIDPESSLLHAAHRAWNALAILELILTRMEGEKEAVK